MIAFWAAAAVASAGAAACMLVNAQAARRARPRPDPTLAAYQRLLGEIDALAERNLLPEADPGPAKAEAGRRLLKAIDQQPPESGNAQSWAAPALCMGAPILALAVYLATGSPDAPDRAYAQRVAEWRAAPERLGPAEAAAVLAKIVRDRPGDAEAATQLARARLAAGDGLGAVRAAETAARLEPRRADRWTGMAEALLGLEPAAVEDARAALTRALALDPGNVEARYWLGQAHFAGDDPKSGEATWSALLRDLPPDDPRHAALEAELASVRAQGPDLNSAIAGMVEGLASRLRAEPLDPQGWSRLVRAYGVLGREREQTAALSEARRLFARRPEVIAKLEAAAAQGRANRRSEKDGVRAGR